MSVKTIVLPLIAVGLANYLGYIFQPKTPGKIVTTKNGKVQGVISTSRDGQDFYEWLGIPYGKVPMRFSTPLPGDSWEGIRDASEYGPICFQVDFLSNIVGDEDCLFLNIHIPKTVFDSGEPVPVIVFIHGGAFSKSSSNDYGPKYFMDHNIVLVSLNYRLGPLGFLNTGDKSSRGNMGLKDQTLAFKWLKDNIRHFGGDPDRITLQGMSSGSTSAHLHLLSPMSKGLISQVICQSGLALHPWSLHRNAVAQSKYLARNVNCPTENTQDMVECLRKRSASQLLLALQDFFGPISTIYDLFVPSVEFVDDEEAFLAVEPQELLESGNFSKLPMLTGTTSDEGLIFGRYYLSHQSYRDYVQKDWEYYLEQSVFFVAEELKHGQKIRDYYFGPDHRLDIFTPETYKMFLDFLTDYSFLRKLVETAQLQSKHSPVYLYRYSKTTIYTFFDVFNAIAEDLPMIIKYPKFYISEYLKKYGLGPKYYGVNHADDLIPQFDCPGIFYVGKNDPLYGFSKDYIQLWVDFAYDHKSMKFRGEAFPPFEPTESHHQIKFFDIDDTPTIRELSHEEKRRLDFWSSIK